MSVPSTVLHALQDSPNVIASARDQVLYKLENGSGYAFGMERVELMEIMEVVRHHLTLAENAVRRQCESFIARNAREDA